MKIERDPGRPAAHVWLVEDNRMFRRAIAAVIEAENDLRCSLVAASCEEAISALDDGGLPDVVLLDIGLPGMDGIEGAREIRSRCPTARLIMLTVHEEDEKVFRAICAGASGYLLKPSGGDEIVGAIRDVISGGAPVNAYIARKVLERFADLAAPGADYGLTEREGEILRLLVDGLLLKQIAGRLEISYHTVDAHVRNVYDKLHVRSRSDAVVKAVKERLV